MSKITVIERNTGQQLTAEMVDNNDRKADRNLIHEVK